MCATDVNKRSGIGKYLILWMASHIRDHRNATDFCTWHDSTAVVACAKFWSDHFFFNYTTLLYHLWIRLTPKIPLVKYPWMINIHYAVPLYWICLTGTKYYLGWCLCDSRNHRPNVDLILVLLIRDRPKKHSG